MPAEPLTREIFGNITPVAQGLFYGLAALSLGVGSWGVVRRVRRWRVGRLPAEPIDWKALFRRFPRRVLRQPTQTVTRPAAGRAHRLLFAGFVVLLIGTILVAIEHWLATLLGHGTVFHRGLYYAIYEVLTDAAGLALLAGCGWYLLRHARGGSSAAGKLSDWLVLAGLAFLGVSGYLVEALRIVHAETPQAGCSFVGAGVAALLKGLGLSQAGAGSFHRVTWWVHAVVALGLIAAIPYTRLWHAVAGVIRLITTDRRLGAMTSVSIADVEATGIFGTPRIIDFDRRQLLSLDACVSCGRCEDECPAHAAGKPLSPMAVVQDLNRHLHTTRDLEARLSDSVIAPETAWACTTCSACTEVCPLGVDPLDLILGLRRDLVGGGRLRGTPAAALQKLQRSGNPWGLPPEERFDWAEGLEVPTVEDNPEFELLYWVGCAASCDRQAGRVARAVVRLLQAADVSFAVLGTGERCTGESARRIGDEFVFEELARQNIEALRVLDGRRIVTHCPHCLNSFRQDYPQLDASFDVVHHSQLLAELIESGRLPSVDTAGSERVTLHDPCYLARVHGEVDAPRRVLAAAGSELVEMPRHGSRTSCCGAGGGRMWFDDPVDERTGRDRVAEAAATGAETVVVGCPFCRTMITDGLADVGAEATVKDLAEVLLESLES